MSSAPETAPEPPGDDAVPRVLVVNRSAMRALFTEHVLTGAGCVVRTLTDPRALAVAVAAFEPDLILTAEPVVEASGVELAALVPAGAGSRLVPVLMGAVDHRRQPRGAEVQDPGEDDLLLARERLLETLNRRLKALRTRPGALSGDGLLDPDTGLASRRHFLNALRCALAEPGIEGPGNGLLIVALDRMSELNRQWGTGTADHAADQIGRLIGQALDGNDLAVRLDDHRHAVLVRGTGEREPWVVAQGLQCAVTDTPCRVRGAAVPISVSIGIGPFSPPAEDTVTMLRRAERACAEAAASGGNAIVLDQPGAGAGSDDPEERRLIRLIEWALAQAAPGAAEEGAAGLRVLYQPVVAVRRQVLYLVEAILCLRDEYGTLLQGPEFLPTAERAGRRGEIDRWLLSRALEVLTREGSAQPRLRLFVRQQVAWLSQDLKFAWLAEEVAARGLFERAPILELEVQDLFTHQHLAVGLVAGLRKCGIQVCVSGVDQTPIGLDLVRELAPPFVKLAPAANQLRADRLAHLIHRLGQGGSEVIACGVDAHALIAPVWASGVGYAQGAAIHAPRPELDFDWDEVVTEEPA